MGMLFSCGLSQYSDEDSDLEMDKPISFNERNSEPKLTESFGSENMKMDEADIELDKMVSTKDRSVELNNQSQRLPVLDLINPKHVAALKLQKVYKSFRTRRKLADCAVLVEQSWWKLLDFAELKRSSISFFDIEKHETAISRWSRARTRAAKVGKGLSKNDKAQKLALQHWLEAIDPRHRYGHNLHFYYLKWLHCQCREPFFYWLDIGEGKEVNLEKCPRSKLQQQCIKYLGPMERLAYEVVVEDGILVYKQSGELVDSTGDAKWIFVLSTSKTLYVGKKKKGTFQHSSFLAGGATSAAGRLVVENGILKAVWPHSGHYRPTEENFKEFVSFLRENNVDLTDVKMSPVDEEDDLVGKQKSGIHIRNNSSEDDLIDKVSGFEEEETNNEEILIENSDIVEKETVEAMQPSKSNRLFSLTTKLTNLKIPNTDEFVEKLESENRESATNSNSLPDSISKKNLFDEEHEEDEEVEIIPEESILKRISSHKEMKSYQLGKQLSCKWTTGAGPRIGCVRDYPPELQLRALEQVSLSPRSASSSRSLFSTVLTPTDSSGRKRVIIRSPRMEEGNPSIRSVHNSRTQSSPLNSGEISNHSC